MISSSSRSCGIAETNGERLFAACTTSAAPAAAAS
jgi:hypothetical protein